MRLRLLPLCLLLACATLAHAWDDISVARGYIAWAASQTAPCTQERLCATSFERWRVQWLDGRLEQGPKLTRAAAPPRDCVCNAKAAFAAGDPLAAVSWIVASHLHNRVALEWLRQHPDAVVLVLNENEYLCDDAAVTRSASPTPSVIPAADAGVQGQTPAAAR